MNQVLKNKWALASLSGLALWLAWPPFSIATFLLFLAFIPLFHVVDQLNIGDEKKKGSAVFRIAFVAFVVWNIPTTYWIWNASGVGAVVAVLLNALLMSLPFVGYYKSLGWNNKRLSYTAFVAYWLAYEYFHLHWDLSWPWLNLGNGLAEWPSIIQWYEYTGTFGGTLWILLINILGYESLLAVQTKSTIFRKKIIGLIVIIIVPMTLSLMIYFNYNEEINPTSIVVVQPNIDPYTEKFSSDPAQQLRKMIGLSDSLGKPNTEFFIWPETALTVTIWEEDLEGSSAVDNIKSFLDRYKNGNVITGAATARQYSTAATPTAHRFGGGECCYDSYNTGLQIENSGKVQIYHKSKLVPGVEKMPFPALMGFLEPLALQLGGTSGSLGSQEERTVFYSQNGIGIAPVICYESIYGEFVAEYIQNGAQLIVIMTNDGWWGNTPGYHQHASYARLRAIETRRCIARSANTGISSFINQRGDILAESKWCEATALTAELNLNSNLTFYTVHGDYIAYFGCTLALLFLLFQLLRPYLLKNSI